MATSVLSPVSKAVGKQDAPRGNVDSLGIPLDANGIPMHGPDVRAELRSRLPGLLAALTPEQVDRWQAYVDHWYVSRKYEAASRRLDTPDTSWSRADIYRGSPEYKQQRARLNRSSPGPAPSADLTVDPRAMLGDDIYAPPAWDVKAEMEFRQWAVAEITQAPLKIDMRPTSSWYEALGQHPILVKNTKGVITARDLIAQYPAEYEAQVSKRQTIQDLRNALDNAQMIFDEVVPEHLERSRINAKRIGFGVVRHVAEFLGPGHKKYPSIQIWDAPKSLLARARPLIDQRKMELAVPFIAMAEKATIDAANQFIPYEKRVMKGAGRAVTALNVVKKASEITFGVASGGLGLTGAALATGGYVFATEGAGRLSEMHYGQRSSFDLGGLLKQAATATAMAFLGGALQSRFQAALKLRLDKAGIVGRDIDVYTSALAAGTSSFYTTLAAIPVEHFVSGKGLPKSADELSDKIVEEAVMNVALDVATNVGTQALSSRASTEYQAWKEGRASRDLLPAKPATKPVDPRAVAQDPATSAKAAELPPSKLPDHVVREMLAKGGGWDKIKGELATGSGLGQSLPVPERRALLNRIEAHREGIAQNAATVLGGEVVVSGDGPATQVEIRFAGEDGAERVKQARDYLDAKAPGWNEQTGIKIEAVPIPESTGLTRSARVIGALEHRLTPEARQLAAEFVPIFENWKGLKTPEARFEKLLEIANRRLVAAGAPPAIPNPMPAPKAGERGLFDHRNWDLHINRDQLTMRDPTPEQFAAAVDTVVHEVEHALQWFRMARIRPSEVVDIDPQAKKAAAEINAGAPHRPGEQLLPGSLEYEKAQQHFEAVYGAQGKTAREAILTERKTATVDHDQALKALDAVKHLPLNDPARKQAESDYRDARLRYEDAFEDYRYLVEEIDARKAGETVAQAVVEHISLIRAIQTARAQDRKAYSDWLKADASDRSTGNKRSSETRANAREEAFKRLEATAAIVKRLEDRLNSLVAREPANSGTKVNLPPSKLSERDVGSVVKALFPAPDWVEKPLFLQGNPTNKTRGRNPLGSSEPEWYSVNNNAAVEVKTKDFVARLESVDWLAITRQLEQRMHAMPKNTENWIVFDIRNQPMSVAEASILPKLSSKWNRVLFLTDKGVFHRAGNNIAPYP